MTQYRISYGGFLYRKVDGGIPEEYNFVKKKWEQDEDASDAFYEGCGSYDASEEEANKLIAEFEKNKS